MARARFDGDMNDLVNRLDRFEQRILTDVPNEITKTVTRECEATKTRMSSVGTGAFANSLVISTSSENAIHSVQFYSDMEVRTRDGSKSYNLGYLLENGAMPHDIRPLGDWLLRFWGTKMHKIIETDYVEHQGFLPKYYRRSEAGVYVVTWHIARNKIKYVTSKKIFSRMMKETR